MSTYELYSGKNHDPFTYYMSTKRKQQKKIAAEKENINKLLGKKDATVD